VIVDVDRSDHADVAAHGLGATRPRQDPDPASVRVLRRFWRRRPRQARDPGPSGPTTR